MSISARLPAGARDSDEAVRKDAPEPAETGERRSPDRPFSAAVAPVETRGKDAPSLQSRLRAEFSLPPAPETKTETTPAPATAPAPATKIFGASPWTSRVIKSAIGLALLVAVGLMPAQRLFQVSSVEAIVNARLVTMRSPIDGVVTGSTTLREGTVITDGMPLGTIANPRADHGRVDMVQDRLEDARADRQTKLAALTELREQRTTLKSQLESFRASRITDATARVAVIDARITSAVAAQERAAAERIRKEKLRDKGNATKAALETAVQDEQMANAAVDEARAARASIKVELDALESGVFYGDDYNDEPRTAQRLDEIDLQIAMTEADVTRLDGAIERAGAAIERERAALELDSKAELRSPVEGRVWQVLTAPGEQVVAGQELFSLLDCSRAIVTSVVSEATYNSLSVGMPATFTFRDGGGALSGKIVQLSGAAEASSNYAIAPSALVGDSYRVSVAVDTKNQGAGCSIGRTGRVVFQASGS